MSSDCDYDYYKIFNGALHDESQNFDEEDYPDFSEHVYAEQLNIVKNQKRLSDPKKNYIKNEEDKKMLFTLIKDEEVIWNSKHKLHKNSNALNTAWNRVVDNMPSMTIEQCKTMWNDIRLATRCRKKLAVKRKFNEIEYEDLTEVEEDNQSITENKMSCNRLDSSSSSKFSTKKLSQCESNHEDWTEPIKQKLSLASKKYKIKNEKEKMQLVEVIKNEEIIWNTKNPLHFNSSALSDAWYRVANEMYPMTLEQCKTMWRSLRDALRYRKKIVAKEKAVSGGEDYIGEENIIEDILSLFSFDCRKRTQKLSRANTFEENETNFSDQNEIPIIYLENGDENFSEDIEDESDIFFKTVTRKLCKKPKKFKVSNHSEQKRGKIKNEKEKRLFVEFMKNEECIWDLQHEYHGEPGYVDEAWQRIANQMSMTIDQCKTMWKSIKDAVRYRRKKISFDDETNIEGDDDNLFEQIQLLFPPDTNKINRNGSVTDKEDDISLLNKSDTRPHSNILEKGKSNEIFQSLGSISKAISELVTIAIKKQSHQSIAPFKYEYVWRVIENLYLQLEDTTINEINQQIINIVYEFCKMKG